MSSPYSDNYSKRFLELYALAKDFSEDFGTNLQETFDYVIQFRDPQFTNREILHKLKRLKYDRPNFKINKSSNSRGNVWLIIGETGQGKSTFVNSLSGCEMAREGDGIDSVTSTVEIYFASKDLAVIDTPGLFDTRSTSNEDICKKIIRKTEDILRENARIEAIFLTWCPNYSQRFRFEEILTDLVRIFGREVLKSIIFLVNKVSDYWTTQHQKAFEELFNDLRKEGLENPCVVYDLKKLDSISIKKLKDIARKVEPYKKEVFEIYSKDCYHKKYLQAIKADEQKREERERLERERIWMEAEMQRKIEAELIEAEYKRQQEIREREARHERELRAERERQEKEYQERQRRIEEEERENKRREQEFKDLQERLRREEEEREKRRQSEIEEAKEERLREKRANERRLRDLEIECGERNRDGVKVWKGERGNHYCGRFGLYSCPYNPPCDGTCGPEDGCNCPACAELDRQFGIEPWIDPPSHGGENWNCVYFPDAGRLYWIKF